MVTSPLNKMILLTRFSVTTNEQQFSITGPSNFDRFRRLYTLDTIAGKSLSAGELLNLARELDRPPDELRKGGSGDESERKSASADSDDSPGTLGDDRRKRRGGGDARSARREKDAKRAREGDPGAGGKAGRSSSSLTTFARDMMAKRPKISLDLDDLDSDDESDQDSD